MIRITTEWVGVSGSPYYSNQFFDGITEAEASSAATAAGVFWTAIADRMGTALEGHVLGEWAVINPADGQLQDVHFGSEIVINCSDATAPIGPATQGLIRWRTGVYNAGREIRGRTFVPLPCTAQNAAPGVPAAAYVADLQAAADAFVAGSSLVVWSRTGGQVAVATAGQVWSNWAVMRSRRD